MVNMNWFSVILVAFSFHTNLALSQESPIETTNDDLNVFLINALETYPEWLWNNSLDPSPPSLFTDNLRINKEDFQLTCTITDEKLVRYANQSNLFEITSVSTTVPNKWMLLGFDTKGVVAFRGNYNASGTIDEYVPLNGNGSWIYTSNMGIHESVNIIFGVDDDGYVQIYDDLFLHNIYLLDESVDEIYFEGLWDDVAAGYAELIQESLRAAYLNRLEDLETRQPARQLIFQYLCDIFKEKTLEDIIGGNR